MIAQHPDRNALERFSRGETAGAEERWIETHLRTGCARCQQEVDDLLTRLLASPPPELSAASEAADENEAWDRLFASLEARLVVATAEREQAPGLVAELLGRSREEWPVLLRLDRRLQTLAVCELLIERCFEEGFRDSARSLE